MALQSPIFLLLFLVLATEKSVSVASVFSSRLIHRFSEEAVASIASRAGRNWSGSWPEKRSLEYYRLLTNSDLRRQKMKLGPKSQFLFPSEGSETMGLGNDFGWLHYMWIDIGTPNVSFLVALDAGSDLLWVPCNCLQCAPLSSTYYSSLDRDLNEYDPSSSSTSKFLSCEHRLCDSAPNCQNPVEQCPYTVNYATENTSSSGLLVEDILHLRSGRSDGLNASVRARVIIGCGKKQSGGYLEGVAPDGLMGLGLGEISVPSFLAKAGLVRNSFSLCFREDHSGRIYFGDMGPSLQQSTRFLPLNNKYITYIVGVDTCCVGNSCLKGSNFRTLIDSGSSFTYLPEAIYQKVAYEFDRRINATISSFDGFPWEYCYKTSVEPELPTMKLMFSPNNSFVIRDPIFRIYQDQELLGFCLAVQPVEEDLGIIGQNFMTGYRLVFDRENMKLSWSASKCRDLSNDKISPWPSPNKTSPYPLPTDEQQSSHGNAGVPPAVAGRTLSGSSTAASLLVTPSVFYSLSLLTLLHAFLYCM
ncbi:PREDICTED: aspartic proteinase-like protein 1 [Tarenaya hassleriana]|uniref:aspartic proteinase-like protein 1 n=1 Tax=Tarenaya hassleriana TaxID=28532 RepID=UPI00053C1AF8|nr:PREDICTED: aspartic proteinase-like protein 1 [Tarenaya hassleriana]